MLTFMLTKILQQVVILYGKRLFAAVVLAGDAVADFAARANSKWVWCRPPEER